jgi:hypothetical protein
MIADLVFVLCALTSALCAVILGRAYVRTRARLLFWSGACFACLALHNVLLFVDLSIVPSVDLSIVRSLPTLIGIVALIYGLVWEVK